MPLSYWSFQPWRELYSPTEQRWWRCRPTLAGVELGFRADDEAEWTRRLTHKPRIKPSGMIVRDREDALQACIRAARPLVAEQLADGMEERSAPAGPQLWQELLAGWREDAPGFDVAPLVEAQARRTAPPLDDVMTWLADATVSEVPADLVWWPPIDKGRRAAAAAAIQQHAKDIVPALLLALRHPEYAATKIIGDALVAAGPFDDDNIVFEALLSRTIHNPPHALQSAVSFTRFIGKLCSPSAERMDRIWRVIDDAPRGLPEREYVPGREAMYQAYVVGFELDLVLRELQQRATTERACSPGRTP
jgi:hypothetical protein